VIERGYEGYVAKDEASVYEAGATRRWVKVKQRDWIVAEDRWRRRIRAPCRSCDRRLRLASRASRRLTVGCPPVSLLTELDAFYVDHRRCGELDAGVDGVVIWFDCECGARIARRADDGDAFDVDA
jgi:hypothetical protein